MRGSRGTSLSTDADSIKRGEVWLVRFDPARGAEIRKTRPAVVVSADGIGTLPLKLVAPLTEWSDSYVDNQWHVRVTPDAINGLTKISAVDLLQIRGMDVRRFSTKLGAMSAPTMLRISAAMRVTFDIP